MTTPGAETLFAHLFDHRLPAEGLRRHTLLFVEAAVATTVAIALPRLLRLDEPGLIGLFLTSAALSSRLHLLLAENRDAVWNSSSQAGANRRTTLAVLTLFAGILTTFMGATLVLGRAQATAQFAFALRAADVTEHSLLVGRFGGVAGVLVHNLWVAVALLLLSAVFRAYGALVALTWNAAVWGSVLTVLIERYAVEHGGHGGHALPKALFALVVVGPHLVLEGAADVLVALAGIFASKGLLSYAMSDPRLHRVAAAVVRLLVVAVLLLAIAAVLETQVAPRLLSR